MADYTQTYTVVLEPSEKQSWRGYCLEIPECTGRGAGKRSAYKAVKEALKRHLRRRLVSGEPVPRRKKTIKFPRFDLRELGADVSQLR